MAAYVQDSQFLTRRSAVFLIIIALHVFVIWALATGLARRAIELVAPPLQTDIVEEVKEMQKKGLNLDFFGFILLAVGFCLELEGRMGVGSYLAQ